MSHLTLFVISVAFILISTYVDSQGIGVNVENKYLIDANFIHDLSKQIESKVQTTYSELNKYIIDGTIVRNVIDLSKQLTKEEAHYIIQELQKNVIRQELQKIRVTRQANPPAKTTRITYTLGKRATGDRVVASNSVNEKYNAAQNISHTIVYPRTGAGSYITYVEIIIDQTSTLGKASAPEGGIGQRSITLALEAQQTLEYRATTAIYGY